MKKEFPCLIISLTNKDIEYIPFGSEEIRDKALTDIVEAKTRWITFSHIDLSILVENIVKIKKGVRKWKVAHD